MHIHLNKAQRCKNPKGIMTEYPVGEHLDAPDEMAQKWIDKGIATAMAPVVASISNIEPEPALSAEEGEEE